MTPDPERADAENFTLGLTLIEHVYSIRGDELWAFGARSLGNEVDGRSAGIREDLDRRSTLKNALSLTILFMNKETQFLALMNHIYVKPISRNASLQSDLRRFTST